MYLVVKNKDVFLGIDVEISKHLCSFLVAKELPVLMITVCFGIAEETEP